MFIFFVICEGPNDDFGEFGLHGMWSLTFHQVSLEERWAFCWEFLSHELRWSREGGAVDGSRTHNCNHPVRQWAEASKQVL